jgi:hypothetical protein
MTGALAMRRKQRGDKPSRSMVVELEPVQAPTGTMGSTYRPNALVDRLYR